MFEDETSDRTNGWKDRKDTRYSVKAWVEVAVGTDGKEYIVKLVD